MLHHVIEKIAGRRVAGALRIFPVHFRRPPARSPARPATGLIAEFPDV
jgi:hypothetical protein